MPMPSVRLLPDDPTVFAKCPKCSRMGLGTKAGSQFYRAYTKSSWRRRPKCENCRTRMVALYEIDKEERSEEKAADRRPARRPVPGNRPRNTLLVASGNSSGHPAERAS